MKTKKYGEEDLFPTTVPVFMVIIISFLVSHLGFVPISISIFVVFFVIILYVCFWLTVLYKREKESDDKYMKRREEYFKTHPKFFDDLYDK